MAESRGDVVHRTIDAVWRMESPRLIAGWTRIVRDVGLAEDLAQDALVAALQQWPQTGVPDNPGAWLMGTAKHRAIDTFRRASQAAPSDTKPLLQLGLLMDGTGRREQAKPIYERTPDRKIVPKARRP